MAEPDKIDAVKKVGKESISEGPVERAEVIANRDHFEALMLQQQQKQQQQQATTVQAVDQTATSKKASLMEQVSELNRKVDQVKKVQPPDIIAQAQEVISKMAEIKEQLAIPNQELKPAYSNLLKNKLTHINDNLRIALSAAGVESVPPPTQVASNNPIDRFLGYLTDGQAQLEGIAKEVQTMSLNKSNMNPAAMLAVQIKVGFIQHELEFFSSVLNKALESTKTIMNVQV